MKRKLALYLSISYFWTWGLWGLAFALAGRAGISLSTDATLFDLFGRFQNSPGLLAQWVFALGVYGPMVGFFIASPKRTGMFLGRARPGQAALALGLPLAVALPGAIVAALTGYFDGSRASFAAVAPYFLSNFLTSGTEEFGWRGFLYPHLRAREKTFWDATWKSGLIWAVWHYPLMLYLYWSLGPVMLVSSLAGFTASIVAMAYISNYIFERTGSVALCMLLHALNNTLSFAMALCFPMSPFVFLLGIASWIAVAVLDRTNKPQAAKPQSA